jgi:hypothetical protein
MPRRAALVFVAQPALAKGVLVGDTRFHDAHPSMRIHRFLSLTDLVVLLVVAVAIFLPRRTVQVVDPYDLDPEPRADLAAAEAVAMAHPDDGAATAAYSRKLAEADVLDWSVEVARDGMDRATPGTKWRDALAVSEVYGKRLDVQSSLDWAQHAQDACKSAGDACPGWEALELGLYISYLQGGLDSGVDVRKEPARFRQEADKRMGMDLIDQQGAGSASAPH